MVNVHESRSKVGAFALNNMRLKIVLIMIAALPLALGACSSVESAHPVGVIPMDPDELKPVEGIWQSKDSVLFLKIVKGNQLKIGSLTWNKKENKFKVTELEGEVRTLNGQYYFNSEHSPPKEESPYPHRNSKYYTFMSFSVKKGGVLEVYSPRIDVFKAAVSAGELRGTVHTTKHARPRTEVHIVAIRANKKLLDQYVKKHGIAKLFSTDKPLVLKRIFSKVPSQ
jgi:hypothetical protein